MQKLLSFFEIFQSSGDLSSQLIESWELKKRGVYNLFSRIENSLECKDRIREYLPLPDGHRMASGMRHPDMVIDHQWDEQILFKTYQEMFKNDHAHVPTDIESYQRLYAIVFFYEGVLNEMPAAASHHVWVDSHLWECSQTIWDELYWEHSALLKKERDREAKNQGLKRKHQTAERGKYLKELRRDVSLRDASTSDKARWILKRWEKDHERDPKTVPEPYAFETIRTKI